MAALTEHERLTMTENLFTPPKVIMGVGRTFDYLGVLGCPGHHWEVLRYVRMVAESAIGCRVEGLLLAG